MAKALNAVMNASKVSHNGMTLTFLRGLRSLVAASGALGHLIQPKPTSLAYA